VEPELREDWERAKGRSGCAWDDAAARDPHSWQRISDTISALSLAIPITTGSDSSARLILN
jgi:hypothetical protein